MPLVMIGTGILWFGWFGFNAGSALAASPIAGLAFVTTMLAPAATLVVWTFLDMMRSGKPTAVVGTAFGQFGGIWAQDEARKAAGIAGARVLEDVKLAAYAIRRDDRDDRDGRWTFGVDVTPELWRVM